MTKSLEALIVEMKVAAKKSKDMAGIYGYKKGIAAKVNFSEIATEDNVLSLIAALEQAEKYAKERDLENQDLMLTIGRLRVEREAANKRIAELEASRLSVDSLPKSENFWSAVADISEQSEMRHLSVAGNVQLGRSDAKALSEWLLSVLPLLGTVQGGE